MADSPSSLLARATDETLQEIDDLLYEVARLAKSESSPQEFHGELLGRAVRALAALGGVVWIRSAEGVFKVESRVDLTQSRLIERLAAHPAHHELLDKIVRSGEGRVVLPQAASGADGTPANPTEFLLLACPMASGEEGAISGVLEVVQRPGGSPGAHQGYLRFLGALSELAADYHRNRRTRALQDRAARSGQFEQFADRVHRSLNVRETAYTIVNEGRRLIRCDRLSVARCRRRNARILAVSGLEIIDRRSNVIRRLEDLVKAVVAAGEPLHYTDDPASLPPQISLPLQAYLDEAHSRAVSIIPLHETDPSEEKSRPSRIIAALVVDRFEGGRDDELFRQRVELVTRQSELALRNALDQENLPLFPVLRLLKKAGWLTRARQLPKTIFAVALLTAAILSLIFVQADFDIEGRGELQPKLRREVFARSDGIVSEIRTEHGQECKKGDILVTLTKSQLDFEFSRVLGELQTARKRLSTVQASRLESRPVTAADREKYNELTAEEEELKESLKNLEKQQQILHAQREELNVKSPLTGQVITWKVRQLLESRPVQRGQALLTVADTNGPWVLEVDVPDDHIGYVLDAQRTNTSQLAVSFRIATEPNVTYHGTVEKIALGTRPEGDSGGANVRVTVAIDRDKIPLLRPGATVVPKIHCGRQAIGFVWFHSLWETIQKRILF